MFVLLKVLLFFIRPLVWIIFVFLWALIAKKEKRKKALFVTGVLLLLFFSNPFIINQIIKHYEATPVDLTPGSRYDAVIVLGGLISYNKKDDKGYFNEASDRFIQTALLYKKGFTDKIIIAAGNGYIVKHGFKESNFIKAHLVSLGIPPSDIYSDSTSKNTWENAVNSRKIIESLSLKGPFLLVTSAVHMPRARQAFQKQKVNVVPYPCNFDSKNVGNNIIEDILLPSAKAMTKWDDLFKEIAGRIVYSFK